MKLERGEDGSKIKELVVEEGGERIDVWLAKNIEQLSRARIQKLIAEGQVTLNQYPCLDKKTIVKAGDVITVTIPPPVASEIIPQSIPLEIVYEDEHILVINKPAGFVVHPAPGHPHSTLVNALLAHCPNLEGIGGVQRPGLVHRLDKDTTGLIVVAKTEMALQDLQRQIKERKAKREYLGIIHGCFPGESGTINLPIGRHPKHRKKMAVLQGGKEAITHWRLVEKLGNYSLLHFSLETGRTHQIRVHCSHFGHPLVGDPLYSSCKNIGVKLTGQALHAFRLTLTHPENGKPLKFVAPIPTEMQKLIEFLRKKRG